MRSVALLLSLLIATPALARDIYVNNAIGDDTSTGREMKTSGKGTGPVRSIAKALRLAKPGDRLVLAKTNEPYREAIAIQGGKNSGFGGDFPLVIEGNNIVIDGSQPIETPWEYVANNVFRTDCRIKSHQVLFVNEEPAARFIVEGNEFDTRRLAPLQYAVWQGQLYFRVEEGKLPTSYALACAGEWTGISIYQANNVIIRDLTVRGFAFDGINAHDLAVNVRLENVASTDNGRSGFTIAGASQVTLDGCSATRNGVAQLRIEQFAAAETVACKFDAKTAPAIWNETGKSREDTVK